MLGYGIAVAFAIALAHHLGLVGKVAEVVGQIASCQRCSVFWGTLCILLFMKSDPVAAAVSALVLSYLADWLGLLIFNELAKLYDIIWKRRNRKSRSSRRKSLHLR